MTDESNWIQLALKGDQDAFGCLVEAYQTPVYNLAYRMLGNSTEAEDAAQETFIRAYTYLRHYDLVRPFRTWLLSIASHYCIDRLRRRRIQFLPLEDELAAPGELELTSPSPTPMSLMIQREREAAIQQLLAGLPPVDRAAITLCYWYDCSYEEIAQMLQLSVSAVKSRLYRARRAMADRIQQQEVKYEL